MQTVKKSKKMLAGINIMCIFAAMKRVSGREKSRFGGIFSAGKSFTNY